MIRPSDVTIVIPCKNEAKTLLSIYQKLKKIGYTILIPLAKNSKDETGEICENNKIPFFIDSGSGKGAAIRESLDKVKTACIVFFDADGSHDTGDIAAMITRLESSDMVIGSRLQGGSLELYDGSLESFLRMFFTLCINQIINIRFGAKITDTQNGFRAAKVESLKELELTSNTFEIETEMVMKMLKARMQIAEIPAREYPRKFGGSGVSLVKHGWRYVFCVASNLF